MVCSSQWVEQRSCLANVTIDGQPARFFYGAPVGADLILFFREPTVRARPSHETLAIAASCHTASRCTACWRAAAAEAGAGGALR